MRLLADRRVKSTQRRLFRTTALRPFLGPLSRMRAYGDSIVYAQRVRLFELAARHLGVARAVRTLPAFQGTFELDLRSHVTRNLLLDNFEGALTPLFRAALPQGSEQGDVIDIGANVGLYSVLAGKLLGDRGRVLAIEPAPSVLPLLRGNLSRNDLGADRVLLFCGAAADRQGVLTLHFQAGNEEYASLGGLSHPFAPDGPAQTVQVPTETLDSLVSRNRLRPVFIKMDTEGAEGIVLAGAQRTLQEHRPALLTEVDDRLLRSLGYSARRLFRMLMDLDYQIFDAYSGEALALDSTPAEFIGEVFGVPRGVAQGRAASSAAGA